MLLTDFNIQEKIRNNDPSLFETLFGLKLFDPKGYKPAQMAPEEKRCSEDIINQMPKYQIPDVQAPISVKKVHLFRFTKKLNKGKNLVSFYQKTGSCVGNGGGQAGMYRNAADIAVGDREKFVYPPFYLYTYGRSRFYMGAFTKGSGSTGSAMAKAMREDGMFGAFEAGLPEFSGLDNGDGVTWGGGTELAWSLITNGSALQAKWKDVAAKHKFETAQPLQTIDEARSVFRDRLGSLTIASNWGGMMQVPLQGSPGNQRRISKRSGNWAHQMSVIAWEDNPEFGELYYVLNSWSPTAHGLITLNGDQVADDSGAPAGGFWIKAAELAWIIRTGEVYPFYDYQGYPAESEYANIVTAA